MRVLITVALVLLISFKVHGTGEMPEDIKPTTTEFYKKGSPFFLFQLHLNKGLFEYDYYEPDYSAYKYYKLDYNSIGFSLGAGYQIKQLQVSFSGGLAKYHYWQAVNEVTSYISIGGELDTVTRTDLNQHVLPEKLAFVQLNMEYNFRISKVIAVAPYVSVQGWKYLDNKFYPVFKDRQTYFEFDNNYSYGGGILLKGLATNNIMLSLKYGFIYNNFDPQGYFESLKKEKFHKSNHLMEISLGLQYKFLN